MSNTATFKGTEVSLSGTFPSVGDGVKDFTVVGADLSEVKLSSLKGKKVILNTFPSIDTPVCALQLKQFSQMVSGNDNVVLLFVAQDLPFAFGRFCAAEGIENALTTSDFRYGEAADSLGVLIKSGVVSGLLARSVLVLDEEQNVIHSELVAEITEEPDYKAALAAI